MSKNLANLSVGKLKKKLWAEFTLWTKLRYSPDGENVYCFTCDRLMQIGTGGCQGGHWLNKGAHPIHYFNENNVRPQCGHCNLALEGNKTEFEKRLRLEIGDDQVDQLEATKRETSKQPRFWYIDQILHYRGEIRRLKSQF